MKRVLTSCFALVLLIGLLAPVGAAEPVNVNTASVEELASLHMIGEAKARAIVADREENGPFESLQDLTRVPGIGESIVARNVDRITFDD